MRSEASEVSSEGSELRSEATELHSLATCHKNAGSELSSKASKVLQTSKVSSRVSEMSSEAMNNNLMHRNYT